MYAVEYGLSEEDADVLSLELYAFGQAAKGRITRWQKHDPPITPLLIKILQEWSFSDEYGTRSEPLARSTLRRWLGFLGDDSAVKYLIGCTREALREGVKTEKERMNLIGLFLSLGDSGSDIALEFLLLVQGENYWQGADAPEVDMTLSEGGDHSHEYTESVRRELQAHAFWAIAALGTARALDVLATGETINPRFTDALDECFEIAARRNAGIFGYPESLGRKLSLRQHCRLSAIYKEHGKKYVPRPIRETDMEEAN